MTYEGESTRILGLPFFGGGLERASDRVLASRGLVSVPSAPCLALAARDREYWRVLASSAVLIPDSGAMALFWRIRGGSIARVSGLALLRHMVEEGGLERCGAVFAVDPSEAESRRNRRFLLEQGLVLEPENTYLAPRYGSEAVADEGLLERLLQRRPRYVLIHLGGGVQERLGAWLAREWRRRAGEATMPAFICTGAAIAFLTGVQARIPTWADRFFLGWAARCWQRPGVFVPRYVKSFALVWHILRYGAESPWGERRREVA